MRTTEVLADPLIDAVAVILTVPAVELYALLWRAGVIEVTHPASKRPASEVLALRPAG
ncbi:Rv1535 domain-containing protein [Mycolicibacter sp. MYC123]|uniref:Rv1535 domain-containing protein n=1 Tax=[Mycobacterium] zoologicum TaxID=2872311 RepID=A0ABU5YEC2_9MYCO|nr:MULTISPECIES: Rv1535 domain-containing protein [unclassified Mycolicibacter]MEB3048408.1 Rv1535 domain-containing protein [Mycolicibacter sp. MYC123]MEB3063856.1 Rv1535 domain-containing protein [Mycolicibacter sp. MYC101]